MNALARITGACKIAKMCSVTRGVKLGSHSAVPDCLSTLPEKSHRTRMAAQSVQGV